MTNVEARRESMLLKIEATVNGTRLRAAFSMIGKGDRTHQRWRSNLSGDRRAVSIRGSPSNKIGANERALIIPVKSRFHSNYVPWKG